MSHLPITAWNGKELSSLYKKIDDLLKGLIVDLNYEVSAVGESFDYKADLKSPKSRSTKFGFMSKGLVWSSV